MQIGFDHRTKNNLWVYCYGYGYGYGYNHQPADCIVSRPGHWFFNHKVDNVTHFQKILNLEGHPIGITGSRVTAILLNGWILPMFGASAVEGLPSKGLPRSSLFDGFSLEHSLNLGVVASKKLPEKNYFLGSDKTVCLKKSPKK